MVKALDWHGNALVLLDQTKLPQAVEYIACYDYRRVCDAIVSLEVRGAPAIGAAAAYAFVLGYRELLLHGLSGPELNKKLEQVKLDLLRTRPTAVNLQWALEQLWSIALANVASTPEDTIDKLETLARKIEENDVRNNKLIGKYGAELLPSNCKILTHCNAGALATCGWGTALGVIRQLHAEKRLRHVYVDETRPLLQGARLTAWELMEDHIPATLITDNMAAWVLKTKEIDAIVVGADRIATNGDTANKIGTMGLAVLANYLHIPFYVAAPSSTFDFSLPSGEGIPIEERSSEEVRAIQNVPTAPAEIPTCNFAFDVTPGELITGIITEYGVLKAPYAAAIQQLQKKSESEK